ncbi:hypothetical protein DL89DRAFT_266614 [Linderina pennispora]|uniref:Uncharacterized protein n=1 Tax=Linderina pennispora TaxID=61395 RepID=A0A1Y1WE58_9FUNG|nr:uncharacterized protein DL89DRAFT_266614 [Linderina pennispora]ORX71618.1 hypothetical protein DL89DRAFT_266614 [Linderina pennispora]
MKYSIPLLALIALCAAAPAPQVINNVDKLKRDSNDNNPWDRRQLNGGNLLAHDVNNNNPWDRR